MKKLLLPVLAGALALTGSAIARSQDQAPAQAQPAAQSGTAIPVTQINGKWHFVFDTEGGDREFEAEFTVDQDGNITGTFGPNKASGTFKDNHLQMLFDATSDELGETSPLKIDGKFNDAGALIGTWQFSSYDGPFKATHPAAAAQQPTQ